MSGWFSGQLFVRWEVIDGDDFDTLAATGVNILGIMKNYQEFHPAESIILVEIDNPMRSPYV